MIKMQVNKLSRADLVDTLKAYKKATGKAIEIGLKEIAKSSARELASKVQPWGLSAAKGKKFEKNIAAQVTTAWFMANTGRLGAVSSMKAAHNAARKNGRVRIPKGGFARANSSRWLGIISETSRDAYIKTQVAKAGRAKAGWVAAGNSLGAGSLSGIPKWISRHLSDKFGASWTKRSSGISSIVTIENQTPYISGLQKNREIMSALRAGQKKGLTRLTIIIHRINK